MSDYIQLTKILVKKNKMGDAGQVNISLFVISQKFVGTNHTSMPRNCIGLFISNKFIE